MGNSSEDVEMHSDTVSNGRKVASVKSLMQWSGANNNSNAHSSQGSVAAAGMKRQPKAN